MNNKKIRKSIDYDNDDEHVIDKKIKIENDNNQEKLDSLIIKTEIGGLKIIANNKFIYSIKLYESKEIDKEISSKENIDIIKSNSVLNKIKNEIELYFKGELKEFKSEINLEEGTPFQIKIWNQLKTVPYGSTSSYAKIAIDAGLDKKYARAIATACRLNKFLLIIPCHRIISSAGKVIGYNGKSGIDKQFILSKIEKSYNK